MDKKKIINIVLLAIVVLVVIGIFRNGTDEGSGELLLKNKGTLATTGTMIPYEENGFRYTFDGVTILFSDNEQGVARIPETKINLEFQNFSRKTDGTPVFLVRPFYVGFYKGECVSVETLEDVDLEGSLLAFASCTWEEETTDIVVTQKDAMVTVFHRSYDKEETGSSFEVAREIDMTTIVK